MSPLIPSILVLSLAACVEVDGLGDDELGSTEQEINNGYVPYDWMVERAVKPAYNCTATLIGPRHALTANHCTGANHAGVVVRFYTEASDFNNNLVRVITRVIIRPGTVSPPTEPDHFIDSNGQYADIAILELDRVAPSTSVPATLFWTYPGSGVVLHAVGAGDHDSAGTNPSTLGELRFAPVVTSSATDDDGKFSVETDRTNPGDSGGPLYYYKKVLGVVKGGKRYTSVPEHLPWILTEIGYSWRHGSSQVGIYHAGTVKTSFYEATEKTCQYACDHSPCDAYNWSSATGFCVLVADVTALVPMSSWRSDAR